MALAEMLPLERVDDASSLPAFLRTYLVLGQEKGGI